MRKMLWSLALCSLAAMAAAAQTGAGAGSGQGAGSGSSGGQGMGAAQAAPTDPLSTYIKGSFKRNSGYLVAAAEKMPDDGYSAKLGTQTETRTFAQMMGHTINANFSSCSQIKGEQNPNTTDFEHTAQTKDQLVKGIHAAMDYCGPIYDGLTDAALMQPRSVQGRDGQTRTIYPLNGAIGNVVHNNEMYGNMVGIFRSKNLVPPSTEASQQGGRRGM